MVRPFAASTFTVERLSPPGLRPAPRCALPRTVRPWTRPPRRLPFITSPAVRNPGASQTRRCRQHAVRSRASRPGPYCRNDDRPQRPPGKSRTRLPGNLAQPARLRSRRQVVPTHRNMPSTGPFAAAAAVETAFAAVGDGWPPAFCLVEQVFGRLDLAVRRSGRAGADGFGHRPAPNAATPQRWADTGRMLLGQCAPLIPEVGSAGSVRTEADLGQQDSDDNDVKSAPCHLGPLAERRQDGRREPVLGR